MFIRILKTILIHILLLCLLGCQNVGEYVDASNATTPSDSGVLMSPSNSTVSPTSTFTSEATNTATLTPTSTHTPSPTPTPFVCTEQHGKIIRDTFVSEAMQTEEIRYTVYVPPCYSNYREYSFPVLYLLHGWPMDEMHWEKLGIFRIMDAWISQGLIGPMLVVLPGVSNPHGMYINSSGGDYSFEGMIVNELVPRIDQRYRTWNTLEGRAIGGISRGGVWALEIGFRNPDLFGRVGGHSPALSVNHPLPAYDPFVLVESVDPAQQIYLSAGDQDWARAWTIRLRDSLQEADANVTYQLHEGAHIDDLWRLGLPEYVHFYAREWPHAVENLPTYSNRVPSPALDSDFQ
mgnify:CR=1 FL=1